MLLLWLAVPAPDLTLSITDPAQRRAAQACAPRLSRKAGGEISALDVTEFRHFHRQTVLKGTMRVLQKPVARPGEMTPTHVIAAHYSWECRLGGGRIPRIKVNPLPG